MPLLYYWRGDNYRRDLDLGAGYHLNQGSPRLHDIELGDSLWAFTRLENGRYVLAAELVVQCWRGARYLIGHPRARPREESPPVPTPEGLQERWRGREVIASAS